MKNGLKILGLLLAVAGAAGKAVLPGMKAQIVIYNGIAAYRSYGTITTVVLAVGVIMLIAGLALSMKDQAAVAQTKKDEKTSIKLQKEKKKSYSPEDIRQSIAEMQKKYPKYPFNKCVAQMDKMDDYQLRLHNLLEVNDLDAFGYTEDILNDVETALCKSMKSFLNYLIVTDDAAKINEKFTQMMNVNQDRFGHVQELLLTLADFVDENINSRDALEKIDFCNEAIRQTMKEDF